MKQQVELPNYRQFTIFAHYSVSAWARLESARRDGRRPPRIAPLFYETRGRFSGATRGEYRRRARTVDELEDVLAQLERDRRAAKKATGAVTLAEMKRISVREYILEHYIPEFVEGRLKPGSQRGRIRIIDRVIDPELGDRRLNSFSKQEMLNIACDWKTKKWPHWKHVLRRKLHQALKARADGEDVEIPPPTEYRPLAHSEYWAAIKALKSIFAHAEEVGWLIDESPATILKIPRRLPGTPLHEREPQRRRKPVKPIVIERVKAACLSVRDQAIIDVLYLAGPRPSEIVVWTWEVVYDFENNRVRKLARLGHGSSGGAFALTKTEKARRVWLVEPLRDTLDAWRIETESRLDRPVKPNELVFPKRGEGRSPYLHMGAWGAVTFAGACRRAGVEPFNIYRLRATAIALLANGGDDRNPEHPWTGVEIAEQMGHSVRTLEDHYLEALADAEEFRGKTIEQVAQEARSLVVGERLEFERELRKLAFDKSPTEIADLLNRRGLRPARRTTWKKTSVEKALVAAGAPQRRTRHLAKARELIFVSATDCSPSEIAELLNLLGFRNSERQHWKPAAISSLLSSEGIERHSDRAAAARRIIKGRADADSAPAIAAVLNERKLVTRHGNVWTAHAVHQAARRLGTPVQQVPRRNAEAEHLMQALAATTSNAEIAKELNAREMTNSRGNPWRKGAVTATLARIGDPRDDLAAAARARMRELALDHGPARIAAVLNAEGRLTRRGTPFSYETVTSALRRAGIEPLLERPQQEGQLQRARRRMAELAKATDAASIADTLNREGYVTGRGKAWTEVAILNSLRAAGRKKAKPSSASLRTKVKNGEALALVRELTPTHSASQIADRLNELGVMTPRGRLWTGNALKQFQQRHGISKRSEMGPIYQRIEKLSITRGASEIAEILNRQGRKTTQGNPWSAPAVKAILASRTKRRALDR